LIHFVPRLNRTFDLAMAVACDSEPSNRIEIKIVIELQRGAELNLLSIYRK